jgi:hypothetical protein
MKKIFLITILSLLTLNANAASIFEKYIGCYSTLEFNGKKTEQSNSLQSEIQFDSSPIVDEQTKETISVIKFFIYSGRLSDGLQHMQLSYLLTDRGNAYTDSFGDHYQFDGKVKFKTKIEDTYTLHINIDILSIESNKLQIQIFNKIDEIGNGSTTNLILEKSNCL